MAKYRLNNQTKKNLKAIEVSFAAAGFDEKETRALARMYYAALSNKSDRLANLKRLDEEDPEIPENPLEELD